MIDLRKNSTIIKGNAKRLRQHKISLPTFAQMRDPSLIPERIKSRLAAENADGSIS
jgi:hypothetical protein